MAPITEQMIRSRAEHNEGEICSLEEISLHQQDIEKIEHLNQWCRDLKILYLQSNLIGKIENVSRLKKLEYINFALNNIERIEGLDTCESLKKLDLTVNFVGEITTFSNLSRLEHFEELFVTGNPCTDFEHYREYLIALLPHLKTLEGKVITRTERLTAEQNFPFIQARIAEQEAAYLKKRALEKIEYEIQRQEKEAALATENLTDEEKTARFWAEESSFTPESRKETYEHKEEVKRKEAPPVEEKKLRKLFNNAGEPLNVNEGKLEFTLTEDDENNSLLLDLAVWKHLETALMDVDIQPRYARVVANSKIFQLSLNYDVAPDSSSARRSQTTGHLLLTMPLVGAVLTPKPKQSTKPAPVKQADNFLEVGGTGDAPNLDIVSQPTDVRETRRVKRAEKPVSEDFVDDDSVPPLM